MLFASRNPNYTEKNTFSIVYCHLQWTVTESGVVRGGSGSAAVVPGDELVMTTPIIEVRVWGLLGGSGSDQLRR
jgi:hypothetical protein